MNSLFSHFRGRISNTTVPSLPVYHTACATLAGEQDQRTGEAVAFQPMGKAKSSDRTNGVFNRQMESLIRIAQPVELLVEAEEADISRKENKFAVGSRIAELKSTNQQTEERLLAMEKRYSQLQSLLDQRTQELKESQTYLKKPDEFPGFAIVKKVEAINSEIFNIAMSIVDLFERCPKMDLEETFVQEIFINQCRGAARLVIGDLLYFVNCQIDEAILYRLPIVPEDSTPMQLALRYILVKWAVKVVGIPGTFPGKDEVTNLYRQIRARGESVFLIDEYFLTNLLLIQSHNRFPPSGD